MDSKLKKSIDNELLNGYKRDSDGIDELCDFSMTSAFNDAGRLIASSMGFSVNILVIFEVLSYGGYDDDRRVAMKHLELNNGVKIPVVGFGTFQLADPKAGEAAILEALRIGYRLLDTAQIYGNERIVGSAIKKSGIPRDELFVTTKVRIGDASYDRTMAAFEQSLRLLGLDYVDLYLVHHPYNDYYGAWRAMNKLCNDGRIRALGVSNFYTSRLLDLIKNSGITPAVNQIEINPYYQQRKLRDWMRDHGVQSESWGPFGQGNQELLRDPTLNGIAKKHGKSIAQVIVRWLIQEGNVVIPRSTSPERIAQNIEVFDFTLPEEDMLAITLLDIPREHTHYDPAFTDNIIARHSK